MSIAQYCIDKKIITYVLSAALLFGGMYAYTKIGRLEDPEFTIKVAQIVTAYPGATAEEVLNEVTDPIETAVQKLGELDKVTSTSYAGKSIISVEIKDEVPKSSLPQVWTKLRHKVSDMQDQLPSGCSTPLVLDDYGDVYGVLYAIYGDGYSMAELKEYAKTLRRELLLCDDVAKIELLGERTETIYLEISRSRLASLGISPGEIAATIAGQNEVAPSGNLTVGDRYIRISPAGKIDSVEELGDLLIVHTDPSTGARSTLRLRDIATIRRGYNDPPGSILRYNGHPCIALGISTVAGGNCMVMADSIDKRLAELLPETPIGIEIGVVSHQATSVDTAIQGFVVNLVEAVIIVIAVLLVAMGLQSGVLIGLVLVVTVMATVLVMWQIGVLFERISLGAFIIALGMLVDNAIVITEAVLIAAQKGEDKVKAAVAIVEQTKWPLLGATGVAILSFAPVGASNDSTGEFCRSLFLVLGISLFLSWIFAITLTPLLAATFLKGKKKKAGEAASDAPVDPYAGPFYRAYRGFLEGCIRHRWLFMMLMLAMLAAACYGFGRVKQNFFPNSTRPQMMIHMRMPEGSAIEATDARIRAMADWVRTLDGVTGVTEMSGTGGLRFLLTYSPENDDTAYGILFVDLADYHLFEEISRQVDDHAAEIAPDALVYTQRFVLGPGDPQKIQMRILGPDGQTLRRYADRCLDVMRADEGHLVEIQTDWQNRVDLLQPIVSEARARNLGVTRRDIAMGLLAATDGSPIGYYKEGDESLPIIVRSPESERNDPESLMSSWFWASNLGRSIPLAQVVDGLQSTTEEALLQRRNRMLCITVKCNPDPNGGETAATVFDRLAPKLLVACADMPEGYSTDWGGEHEDSGRANSSLGSKLPAVLLMMVFVVICLFNSLRQPLVIFMTVPLIIIGVVVGLLSFDQPFGFMALLGFLSLIGMQIKNAIVLIDEINAQTAAGVEPYTAVVNAGVTRVRPVALSAGTTVLGMLPLVVDAFYAAMAVTIMCGLTFATLLTMVVIPVNYTILFRIPIPEKR